MAASSFFTEEELLDGQTQEETVLSERAAGLTEEPASFEDEDAGDTRVYDDPAGFLFSGLRLPMLASVWD